jgi:hypothetical protein
MIKILRNERKPGPHGRCKLLLSKDLRLFIYFLNYSIDNDDII